MQRVVPSKRTWAVGAGVALGAVAAARLARKGGGVERLVALPGVREVIEIRRDAWGIPHIRANSIPDVMFGLGYATAADRLWQLDILHRAAFGRLAEIIGEPLLEVDRFMRSLGIQRAAEAEVAHLTGETKEMLEGFAAGVNAYVARKGALLGAEFIAGRYRPLPWSPAASIGNLKMMGWTLDGFLETLLLRDRVAGEIGEEWAAYFFGDDLRLAPRDVVVSSAAYTALRARVERVTETLEHVAGLPTANPGSNNWAVSGARTASGKPLLANDPHLAFSIPSIWYECHLTAPGLNAAGATIPGVPGVAIGHNDHMAWGITAAMLVQTEAYIEEVDPQDRRRYRTEDGWETMRCVMDVIPVKGRAAEPHETRLTRHGPIISGMGEAKHETRAIALKWVGHEIADEMTGLLGLMRATSAAEFRAACAGIGVPALNLVFADIEGHIGYQYVGRAPVRPPGCGVRPVPGWTGQYEWNGYIPFDAMPALTDPPEGYIATANSRIEDADFPYPLPSLYQPPLRLTRIRQLLDGRTGLTMADMRRIQADVYNLHAEPLRPLVLAILDAADRTLTPEESLARELLRAWDGFMEVDSPGAAIWAVTYDRWMHRVLRARFSPALARAVTTTFLGSANWYVPDRLLHGDDIGWFTETTVAAAVVGAFVDAVAWLLAHVGPYPAEWEWGHIHRVTFTHPIGQGNKAVARLVNVGPIPVAGENNTVNCASWTLSQPFAVVGGASYRLLVDLSDPSRDTHAVGSNILGTSGNPRAKHYRDQTLRWSRVRYHPMGTDAAEIVSRAPAVVRLVPADQQ